MNYYLNVMTSPSIISGMFVIFWWFMYRGLVLENLLFRDSIILGIVTWVYHLLPLSTVILFFIK